MDDELSKQLALLLVTFAVIFVPVLIVRSSESGLFKLNVATAAISLGIYLSIVGITVFEQEGAAVTIEAFGRQPLGIPWYVFTPLVVFALGIPVPLLIRRVLAGRFIQFGVLDPADLPDHWAYGKAAARWVMAYLAVLLVLWIAFTEHRGI